MKDARVPNGRAGRRPTQARRELGWDGDVDLRALAEAIPGLVFVADTAGDNLFTNGRFQSYAGLDFDALLGRGWLEVVHPEDRDRVAAIWESAVAASEPYEVEMRLRSAEGDYLWHLARATPVREGGRVRRWVGHCADVDDRTRSEAAQKSALAAAADQSETDRRTAEELAARLIEATADCVKTLSLDGRLLSMNAAGLLAVEADCIGDLLGTSWLELWRPSGFHIAAQHAIERAALGGTGRFVGFCRTVKGTPKWWDVVITPVRDANGTMERLLCVSRDITEARNMEERFRLIAETVREVFYHTEIATGRVLYVSPAYTSVWGRPAEKLAEDPRAFLHGIHPEDRPRILAVLERQRRGEATRCSYRVVRPDGTIRLVRDIASPVIDANGRPTHMVGAVEDITGEAEAEARFRTVFQSMFNFIGLLAPDGTLLEANDAALAFGGTSAEEVLGRKFWDTPWWDVGAEAQERLRAAVAEAAAGRFVRYEATVRVAGGGRAPIDFSIKPVFDATGQVVELIPEGRDLTPFKGTDEAPGRDALRFEQALEAAQAGIWSWDTVSGVASWDDRYHELYGLGPEDPRTFETWIARIHPEDRPRILARLEAMARTPGNDEWRIEFRAIHPEGERWLLDLGRAERDAEGRLLRMTGLNFDISERKATEAALRDSETRLHLALDGGQLATWEWAVTTGEVRLDERWMRMRGYEPGEFVPTLQNVRENTHPDDRTRVMEAVAAHLDGTTPTLATESRARTKGGGWIWVAARGQVSKRDSEGRPLRLTGVDVDITEPKRAEAELRESEGRFRAVFENAGVGMARASFVDGRCLQVNDRVCDILGYTREELLSLSWPAITHPDDLEPDLSQFRRLAAGEIEGYAVEKRYIRKDGTPVWVRLTLSLARDAEGRPDFEVAIVEDISERKAAEAALRDSEELNRRILVTSPDCMKLLTLDGRLEFFSEGGLCAMEVDDFDAQLRGTEWVSFWQPEDQPRVRAAIDAALRGGTGRFQAFCRTFKGTPKWWDVSVNAILGADGQPERLLSISRDVTKQRGAEERLALLAETAGGLLGAKEPEAVMAGVFDLIAGPLRLDAFFNYHLDEAGELRLAAHAGISERAAEEGSRLTLGQAVCGCVARDQRPAHVEDVQNSEDPQHAFIRAQGLTAYACTPLVVGDRLLGTLGFGRRSGERFEEDELIFLRTLCHHVATAIDRVRAEERLQSFNAALEARVAERTASLEGTARALQAEMTRREAAQSQLLQAQKMEALGQLVGGVAHDFNNVLAAIQGAFSLLDRRLSDPQLRFVVDQGQKAGERAMALIRQLLAFARREVIEPKVVHLPELLAGAEGMISYAAGSRIECTLDVAPDTWAVLVDPHQLEVALLNLAVNARDAMPDGGTLGIHARNLGPQEPRPETLAPGDYVVISVSDNGCGMDEATAARVFEPFFTTKEAGRGTGLGLAQVHGFVTGTGGGVAIASAPGQGTTVSVFLPRSALHPAEAGAPQIVAAELHGGATILLVDDDDQMRSVTAAYLRELGYAVVEAGSAPAAAAMARIHAIDLLVTDVRMPGTDGPTLARTFRTDWPERPVLFITGHPGTHELKAETVVAKPFTGSELALHLLEALGRIPVGAARRLNATPRERQRLLARLTVPALRAAYDRWTDSLGGRRLPDLAAFDAAGLATEAMAVMSLEEGGGPLRFRVQSLGESLAMRLARPLVGEAIGAEDEELLGSMDAAYRRCLSTLSPAYDWARIRLGEGTMRFERLVLPFSADGAHITHIVSFVHFVDPA